MGYLFSICLLLKLFILSFNKSTRIKMHYCSCAAALRREATAQRAAFAVLRHCPRELPLVFLIKLLESFAYFAMSMNFTIYLNEFGFNGKFLMDTSSTDSQYNVIKQCYLDLKTKDGFTDGIDC